MQDGKKKAPDQADVSAESIESATQESKEPLDGQSAKQEAATAPAREESVGEQSAKDARKQEASEADRVSSDKEAVKQPPTEHDAKSDEHTSDQSAPKKSDKNALDKEPDDEPADKAADLTESAKPAEPDQSTSKQPAKKEPQEKVETPVQGMESSRFEKLRAAALGLGWKKWAAIAIVVFVLLSTGLFLAFGTSHVIERSDRDAKENIYMVVKPGTTASEISDRLMTLGVIDSRLRFWWLMKLQGDASKFKTGTYAFSPHMDEQAVLDKLVAGDTTVVKFTIPEGFGIKEIAKRLADEGLVDEQEFLAEAKDFAPYDYMKKRPNERYAAEGYLFPDTYVIHSDVSAEGIMKMMAEDFDTRLTPELRQQAAAKGLSIHDLVTLASLVEKEARYDEDRPIIAQVFFKRLQLGMPLQSDTTLQYLMSGPKEDVSIEDTKIDSPYNTYQHEGLPPGPIASPGMKSILAVLNPANTDYLYFVADRQGHNHYSQTYDEHLAIVEQVR